MRFISIFSYTGLVMQVIGILLLIPLPFSWYFGEQTFIPFLTASLVSFVCGVFLDRKFEKKKLRMESAMMLSAVTIILISLLGSIPYLFYVSPIDAVFESVSGFTTTGLTVITPESMPFSILVWRSITQWIGGLGILVMFLLLLGSPGMSSYHIYRSEGQVHRIEPSIQHTIRRILYIYCGYTILGIILLLISGMTSFDALNHGLTAISTGGFSTHSNSLGYYNSLPVNMVVMALMILGATSFFIHDKLLRKKITDYLENQETRIFWTLFVLFSAALSLSFLGKTDSVMQAVFHTISALTASGFTIADGAYPGSAIFLLMILMVIGGYAGSTAGGIKLIRFGILVNSIKWLVKKSSLPITAVIPVKAGDKTLDTKEITIVSIFVSLYLVILVLCTITLSVAGYSPTDSLFQSASSLGTVGLSTMNISLIPATAKMMIIICMLLGRLEILPFLVLVYKILNKKSK